MKIFLQNLERLNRHYQQSVKSYDEISLLDLAHALRNWCDLQEHLSAVAPLLDKSIAFKTESTNKIVNRAMNGVPHILVLLTDGTRTCASNGNLSNGPETSDFYYAKVRFKWDPPALIISHFAYIEKELKEGEIENLERALKHMPIRRCNFKSWLNAEAARWAYRDKSGELKTFRLSREGMIKSVANTLGASHPAKQANQLKRDEDRAVHYLLNYLVGGLPLPYFILLKIAQDILRIMPKFAAPSSGSFLWRDGIA